MSIKPISHEDFQKLKNILEIDGTHRFHITSNDSEYNEAFSGVLLDRSELFIARSGNNFYQGNITLDKTHIYSQEHYHELVDLETALMLEDVKRMH